MHKTGGSSVSWWRRSVVDEIHYILSYLGIHISTGWISATYGFMLKFLCIDKILHIAAEDLNGIGKA